MSAAALLAELHHRGVSVGVVGEKLRVEAPVGTITPEVKAALTEYKLELRRLLLLTRILATWNAGELIAFRDKNSLFTAKFDTVTTIGKVEVTIQLADGALRTVPVEAVALDWSRDGVEIFAERLCIMLEAGVPGEVARLRAEECTREYLDRLRGGVA
jgi:hypothetical protein